MTNFDCYIRPWRANDANQQIHVNLQQTRWTTNHITLHLQIVFQLHSTHWFCARRLAFKIRVNVLFLCLRSWCIWSWNVFNFRSISIAAWTFLFICQCGQIANHNKNQRCITYLPCCVVRLHAHLHKFMLCYVSSEWATWYIIDACIHTVNMIGNKFVLRARPSTVLPNYCCFWHTQCRTNGQ